MSTKNMKEYKLNISVILIASFSLLAILNLGCAAQKEITHHEKIEILKIDSVKFSFANHFIDLSKGKIVQTTCYVSLPLTRIEVKSFEFLDKNSKIIPARIIGGERAIIHKIVYPELVKRSEIEGIVYLEFEIDKHGIANDITITKDIGSLCGEETINAITKTKFIPAKLNNLPVDTRYRMAIQFKIIPITKEE